MPTGGLYFRVTKDFRTEGGEENWPREGQTVQINHIMGSTGDARSAVLVQTLANGPAVDIGGMALMVVLPLVIGTVIPYLIIDVALYRLGLSEDRAYDYDYVGNVWNCANLWITICGITLLAIGCNVGLYLKGTPPDTVGTCEDSMPTADLTAGLPPAAEVVEVTVNPAADVETDG
jgi:hypothetical protein